MRLQPSLQQVPGRGVAIDAMHDGLTLADAGHLPEQVDVHAQAPAAIDGTGGASLKGRRGLLIWLVKAAAATLRDDPDQALAVSLGRAG